jgi:hypothetical protein
MVEHEWTDDTRGELCAEAGGFFVAVGLEARLEPAEDYVRAVGALMQMTGDLIRGSLDLLKSRHFYAAATLARGILESGSLLGYFTQKPERAAFWLNASSKDMKNAQDFRPKKLREAVGSSDEVYDHHCVLGGHPRNEGLLLLPGSPLRRASAVSVRVAETVVPMTLRGVLLVDLLQHTTSVVGASLEALTAEFTSGKFRDRPVLAKISTVVERLEEWQETDPAARASLDDSGLTHGQLRD